MVADALDRLHDRYPGCETLAFADLSTNMVLITNSNTTFRREGLDSLCSEAALAFGTDGTRTIGDAAAMTAFVATRDQLRIYIRDAREPHDALCCVCSHEVAVDSFLKDARACLHEISNGA
ncbi:MULTISPECIES: hypothetical protein [unclassified Yoonia]|uniref:hypothetical protein n=1 Tax=unclassified Yoonia TaxID=2629118 RepID=UPI002AFF6DF6|nr:MULTISPECIES: hypothetical protein [unclassified Yoonia]